MRFAVFLPEMVVRQPSLTGKTYRIQFFQGWDDDDADTLRQIGGAAFIQVLGVRIIVEKAEPEFFLDPTQRYAVVGIIFLTEHIAFDVYTEIRASGSEHRQLPLHFPIFHSPLAPYCYNPKKERMMVATTTRKMQLPNHDAATFPVSWSPEFHFWYTLTAPISPNNAPTAYISCVPLSK